MCTSACMICGMLCSTAQPSSCTALRWWPLISQGMRCWLQGLADAFILLGLPFDSPEAQLLNREIFETVYFAALEESTRLASVEGALCASGLLWDAVHC